jgi:hypothetical protein
VSKQETFFDISKTVSGLPAPEGWYCVKRESNAQGIYGCIWERLFGERLRVIESISQRSDGRDWLHVSISKQNRKLPTHEHLLLLRNLFVGEHRECYQIFPTQERYVNIHPGVLHLYCCLNVPTGVLPQFEGTFEINGQKVLGV